MNTSVPQIMKAAAIGRLGGPEVLELMSLPVPRPKAKEVRQAASAHRQVGKHHLGKLAFEIRPS